MILDAKVAFKTVAGSEDLATSDATAVVSDYIDLMSAGYADGGGELSVIARVDAVATLAVGTDVTFALTECATSDGTYTTVASKVVLRADVVADTIVLESKLPKGLKRYLKFSVTPAANMTGAVTTHAALIVE